MDMRLTNFFQEFNFKSEVVNAFNYYDNKSGKWLGLAGEVKKTIVQMFHLILDQFFSHKNNGTFHFPFVTYYFS